MLQSVSNIASDLFSILENSSDLHYVRVTTILQYGNLLHDRLPCNLCFGYLQGDFVNTIINTFDHLQANTDFSHNDKMHFKVF